MNYLSNARAFLFGYSWLTLSSSTYTPTTDYLINVAGQASEKVGSDIEEQTKVEKNQ